MEGDMSWYRRRLIYLFAISQKFDTTRWNENIFQQHSGLDQMENFSRIHLIRAVVHETDCEILDWLENAGISH